MNDMYTTTRFPEEVTEILERAGWFSGRRVDDDTFENWRRTLLTSDDIEMSSAAEVVLREFGGLAIESTKRGVDVARMSLELDPLQAEGGAQELRRLAVVAGVPVFPLGTFADGDGLFLIDESGKVYLDFDMTVPVADSFDEALVRLLLGIK
jgi:hypothetical protein